MKTPLGNKNGRLTIYESGSTLTGYIEILAHRTVIQGNEQDNGQYRFSGEFITPVRNIAFYAQGIADAKHVLLDVKAGILDLSISGEADPDQN
jgi:hypothetical protein